MCHLLALLGAHHILHISRRRVKGHCNPLNAELNPMCHLLALLGAHHILHVSRIMVKVNVIQKIKVYAFYFYKNVVFTTFSDFIIQVHQKMNQDT